MFGFKWNGLYRAPNDGGAGGGGDIAPTGNAPGNAQPPAGAQTNGDGGGVTFTPEQQKHVDELIKQRLERERAKLQAEQQAATQHAQEEAERKRLAEEAKWKELAETSQTKIVTLEAEKKAHELVNLRREVAQAAGLTLELAGRLQGSTREELEADAKALAKLLPPDPRPAIAVEVGLPKELAGRILQGTHDEMLADARELLKWVRAVGPGSPTGPGRTGQQPQDELTDERTLALRQRYRIRHS